jgi:alkylation response protein AidB-like acyl-CoA dehydrogenase
MDFDLTPEQEQVRKLAREFCDREIAPGARDRDRDEDVPAELLDKLREVGFLGAPIPEQYGGMGLDYLSYGLITEELGRTDASLRSVVSINVGLVGLTILRFGHDEQKEEWLPRLCTEGLGAFGLTEPDAGSDPASMTTGASRDGSDWILNGAKMWISNGSTGIVTLIFARAGPVQARRGRSGAEDRADRARLRPLLAGRRVHGHLAGLS